jgi:hypothetical protein
VDSLAEEVFRAKQAQDKLDQQAVAKPTDEKADRAKDTEARSMDVKATPAKKVNIRLTTSSPESTEVCLSRLGFLTMPSLTV